MDRAYERAVEVTYIKHRLETWVMNWGGGLMSELSCSWFFSVRNI
jgi:hypothetical protein